MRCVALGLLTLLLAACGGATVAETNRAGDGGAAFVPPSQAGPPNGGTTTPRPPQPRPLPTSQPTAPPQASCNLAPGAACKPPHHVATVGELLAIADALPAQWPYQGGVLTASDDLVADADLEVKRTDIKPSSQCTGVYCDSAVNAIGYPHYSAVSGVSCTTKPTCGSCCPAVTIAKGATFRVRHINQVHLPSSDSTQLLEFVEPCAEPCAPGYLRCGATNTCLSPGKEWCLNCEGSGTQLCACRTDECGMKPAGTLCSFESGDYGQSGACSAEGCKPK